MNPRFHQCQELQIKDVIWIISTAKNKRKWEYRRIWLINACAYDSTLLENMLCAYLVVCTLFRILVYSASWRQWSVAWRQKDEHGRSCHPSEQKCYLRPSYCLLLSSCLVKTFQCLIRTSYFYGEKWITSSFNSLVYLLHVVWGVFTWRLFEVDWPEDLSIAIINSSDKNWHMRLTKVV